jgi:serine/threonine protein kinase
MTDRSGQQLDNYRLLRVLGEGTFGEVYLGENIHRKTQVAVKVLHAHLSNDQFFSFINEARIFRLRHPNIIPVIDFGVERGTSIPFIVMDYAPNGTLRQRHAKGSHVPLASIVQYVNQVAAALQYAHEENIVHRDVKPENMLIGQHGEILLSDFGVAVDRQGDSTAIQETQLTAGTPYYMAPEQFVGKPSRASDQYALGIVVYEWLRGAPPFQGTFFELFGQHTRSTPPPLPRLIELYSPALEQVVMRALAKEPKSRFASVQEFAAALQEVYRQALAAQVMPSASGRTKEQWLADGDTYYRTRRNDEAIAAYSQAIALDPDYAMAYNNRGTAYHNLQQYRQAIADYDRAIELNPGYTTAYNNRGSAYYSLGDYHKAIADFDRVIALTPQNASAYNNRGTAYHDLQEYQRAIADYDQALALDPGYSPARTNREASLRKLREQ